jgi:hypothetical protein
MPRTRLSNCVLHRSWHVLLLSVMMSSVAIAESSERESTLKEDMQMQRDAMSSDLETKQATQTDRQLAANGSRNDSVGIPANAHAKSYGSGWECDLGFREANGKCAVVQVPANAYRIASSYGRGWECSRGYRRSGAACEAIKIPVNAFLNSYGNNWRCERGYRKIDETCVFINVPANGYLTFATYGIGWKCDRGYRAVGQACIAINVPANGYPTNSEHGTGWECNRGYQAGDAVCAEIRVPDNAHLNNFGNDWACDRPYRKEKERCVLP